jgi:hypothetical protein
LLEKKRPEDVLAETLLMTIGSPESRAAARRILGQTPIVITQYVAREGPRDEEGRPTGPIREFKSALVEGKTLNREESESLEDFEQRCIRVLPARKWGFLTMWSNP